MFGGVGGGLLGDWYSGLERGDREENEDVCVYESECEDGGGEVR